MREKLLNFLNLSNRTYYEWKNYKHPNIIQIINDVFITKEDIMFFDLFEELPFDKYFIDNSTFNKNQSKIFKNKLCQLLDIEPSSYYHWQKGKRRNIIKLFHLIFKNVDNIEFWLTHKQFEIKNQKIDDTLYNFINILCNGQKFFESKNNPLNIGDLSSGLGLKFFNIQNPIIYFLLNLDIAKIDQNNIKYSLINDIRLKNYISIDSYIHFLEVLDSFKEQDLKKIFNKSLLHLNFLDSIKKLDIDLFVKLILLSLSLSKCITYNHTKYSVNLLLCTELNKIVKIEDRIKTILLLIDELFDKIKWQQQIEIKKNENKNVSLIDKKVELMMSIYTSPLLKQISC